MSDEAFRRMPMHLKRRLYAAIKETRNMVSITDVMGSDIQTILICSHIHFLVRIYHYVDAGMGIKVE